MAYLSKDSETEETLELALKQSMHFRIELNRIEWWNWVLHVFAL